MRFGVLARVARRLRIRVVVGEGSLVWLLRDRKMRRALRERPLREDYGWWF